MKTWLYRQLSLGDDFVSHLDDATLTMHNPRTFIAGLILLVPIAIFIYLRQARNLPNVPRGLRWTLTLTRVLILLLLVTVLGSPYLRLDLRSEKKPIVAILFDQSQSMMLPAGPYTSEPELWNLANAAGYKSRDSETRLTLVKMSRAKLAQNVCMAKGSPFLKRLAKKYDVRYYTFSREMTELGLDPADPKIPDPPGTGGPSTNIGDAVSRILDDAAGRQVAGMIVFTDGQNNAGSSPADAAQNAGALNAPLFPVPVGSSKRLRDVAIVDLFSTSLVTVDDTARVAVTIESHGFNGRTVKVELLDGETVLDSKELKLRDTEQQQIELTFKATKPGSRYLTVRIPPQEEEPEHLRANNTDTAFVRVSEEKLKVLYLEGRAHWDFRFLKNALRRDNGIGGRLIKEVDIVLETEWKRLSKVDQAKALPKNLDQLSEYHTVILGDVSPELLTPGLVDLLAKAVREKGLGLVVQAGWVNMPHAFSSKLQDLLPVRLQPKQAGRYPVGIPSFKLELAPEGSLNEAMRFYDDPGRNVNTWGTLPRYYWCAAATRPSPGATVLAYNPIKTSYGKVPLIAQHYAGAGRVLFVGTDETFRWRQNVGERFFYRFWGQAVRFVARRDTKGKKSWIEARPLRAQVGEQAEIELMAFGENGAALTQSKQTIQVSGGGKLQTVEVSADPLVKGRYTGRFTPKVAGDYEVSYDAPGEKNPIKAKLRATAGGEELRQPNVNRPALEQLASTSGGQMVELPDLDTIEDKLSGDPKYLNLHREASLWDNWLVLALLIGLYTIDVGLRRLLGLS